jgi:hypothetical protein
MAGELKLDATGKLQLNASGQFTTDCSSPCDNCFSTVGDATVTESGCGISGTFGHIAQNVSGDGCYWIWVLTIDGTTSATLVVVYCPTEGWLAHLRKTVSAVITGKYGGTTTPSCEGTFNFYGVPTGTIVCVGTTLTGNFTLPAISGCATGTAAISF